MPEVDSMGEVVEGRVDVSSTTFSQGVEIEKVQIELRQEYNFREEKKRELEFLEKGGNPLDFKHENAASICVQSTSFTDQHPNLFPTSAKVSLGFVLSPCGDPVESSDSPGSCPCEPSSGDNLILIDTENELYGGNQTSRHPIKSHIGLLKQSFKMDECQKTLKGPEDSTAFNHARKAYKRLYRSRRNRDDARSISTGANPTSGSHGSPLPSSNNHQDAIELALNCNSESASPIVGVHLKAVLPDGQRAELNGARTIELNDNLTKEVSVDAFSDNIASENLFEDQRDKRSLSGSAITPVQLNLDQPETVHPIEKSTFSAIDSQTSVICVNQFGSCQMNCFSLVEGGVVHNVHKSNSPIINGLDSDLSCTQNISSIDGEKVSKMSNIDSNGIIKNKKLLSDGATVMEGNEPVRENKMVESVVSSTLVNEETDSDCPSRQNNGFALQPQKDLNQRGCTLRNDVTKEIVGDAIGLESEKTHGALLDDDSGKEKKNYCVVKHQNSTGISTSKDSEVASLTRVSSVSLDAQISPGPSTILGNGIDEDSILKEAHIIETKRKRILELSMATAPMKFHSKSHWDYVLEEMAWLANDFAQERIWKIAAAAQICHQTMFLSRLKRQENNRDMEAKKVAHTLAKAVTSFWHSVKEFSIEQEQKKQEGAEFSSVAYAVSFLQHSKSNVLWNQVEAAVPLTPDRTSEIGIRYRSWDDNLMEDNLVYAVPLGATETYRKSIEFYEAQSERTENIVQEEPETSDCDVAAGSNILSMQYADIKVLTRQYPSPLKGPDGRLKVSIPTKRVRTVSRRVISPFGVGTSGCIAGTNKADVSSGDTSSFQDGPNSLESEFIGEFEEQSPFTSAEVSTKFKKKPKYMQNAYKQRRKFDSSYQNEQIAHWKKGSDVYQLESSGSDSLLGQPMLKKLKMLQSHANSYDNNITSIGVSVASPVASQMSNMSHPTKISKVVGGRDHDRNRKPKFLKIPAGQPASGTQWSLFEDQALVVLVHDLGPNWELISDAINDALHFKRIFRKPKDCNERHHVLMDGTSGDIADSAEDSESSQPYQCTLPGIPKGSARQLFQRLQEPMDEDTLNSHFDKIIVLGQKHHSRKSQDPKQLQQPHTSHTIALAQVCPNNLNGGPVLTPLDFYEATLAGPDSLGHQGPSSNLLTNSYQGTIASMLPVCGTSSAIQGSSPMIHNNSFPSSHGSCHTSSRNGRYGTPRSASLAADDQHRIQQCGQTVSGRNISQHNIYAPYVLTGSDRDVRTLPGGNDTGMVGGGSSSIPATRPRLQGDVSSSKLNPRSMVSSVMVSTNLHSGKDSGSSLVRSHEASHKIRPGIGLDSQRQMMLSDHQMQVSSGNSQGMPLFSGSSLPNQTTSPLMSSYPLHHRQSHPTSPQHPHVLSPRNPHFQGSATHMHNPQQRAYASHLAKESQLNQHYLHQQSQHQFGVSNSLTPHVRSQSQVPISAAMRKSSPVQQQTCSTPVSLSTLTPVSATNSLPQYQQQHHPPTQLSEHNSQMGSSELINQAGGQRQRQQQQFSQASRQHPLQRQQSQSQEHAKVLYGAGPTMNQTFPIDPSPLNGVSTNPGSQCSIKGERAAPLVQSQDLSVGSTQNVVLSTQPYVPSQPSNKSLPQQKAYSSETSSMSKHHHLNSNSHASSHGRASLVTHAGLSAVQQSVPSLAMAGAKHQLALPHGKLGNQTQSIIHRAVRQTGPMNSGPSNKGQARKFDSRHPTCGSSEMDTMTNIDSNDLSSPVHPQQSQQSVPPPHQPSTQLQQPPLPLHSQKQAKLLQAGNGNLCSIPVAREHNES